MRNSWLMIVGLLVMAAALQAAPPLGVWSLNGNGYPGTLNITLVDGAGNVYGTMYGQPIKGFWSEAAQELVIYRAIGGTTSSTPPEAIQIYTGYKFPGSVSNPNGSQRLAGYFEAFAGTGATAPRHRFGWYASK